MCSVSDCDEILKAIYSAWPTDLAASQCVRRHGRELHTWPIRLEQLRVMLTEKLPGQFTELTDPLVQHLLLSTEATQDEATTPLEYLYFLCAQPLGAHFGCSHSGSMARRAAAVQVCPASVFLSPNQDGRPYGTKLLDHSWLTVGSDQSQL